MTKKLSSSCVLVIVTFATLFVVGCSDEIVIKRRGPTEAQALTALQNTVAQGTSLFAVSLPRTVTLASVKLSQCESAKPQQGFRCMVSVATSDIPILGGFVATLPIRFVEIKTSEWTAYVN